jgi:hypothetical protein
MLSGDDWPLRGWRGDKLVAKPGLKLALLLVSIVLSVTAFLTLDWLYTAMRGPSKQAATTSPCRVRDPIRHHVLMPNCSERAIWGADPYEFSTNSIGFRDERIRKVPASDARPRVLLLGDSFTQGMIAWRDSYAGKIAAALPQYDFLNGGVSSYSPSNYLNVARMVLARGIEIDEVIVFMDTSDVQDEAACYRDVDASGAVTSPVVTRRIESSYGNWRDSVSESFALTSCLLRLLDRLLVRFGYYNLIVDHMGNVFDMERAAWSYRKVNESAPAYQGYAPLGVERGIAKEKAKMTLLWQELAARGIPLSVVVYPYPAQILHDTADSREVLIWREWCEGKCKRFLSLFPAFVALKERCSRIQRGCWYMQSFVFGDYHYNAAGNALVADAIITSLTEVAPLKLLTTSTGSTSRQVPILGH